MIPTYAVLDVETTANSPIGNKATAFHPSNRVVLVGYKCGHMDAPVSFEPTRHQVRFGTNTENSHNPIRLLVGHNIGFDIHHMRQAGLIDEEFLGTVSLWDTQLAEYILSGQTHTYASLDELSEKYGGTQKDSAVKAAFESGQGADKVPLPLLIDYLRDDVQNTELVFLKQVERAVDMGLLPLIQSQMDALAATTEMTYNGLTVERTALSFGALTLQSEVLELEGELQDMAARLFDFPQLNLSSPKQLSLFLYGGEWEEREKVQDGFYKNGKPKFKTVAVKKKREQNILYRRTTPHGPSGYYSTDDKALKHVRSTYDPGANAHTFITKLLEWREKNKQLTTYWRGLLELVMPDGRIHHQLNHCVTRTGRLSSSSPNLQNVTNGNIKQVFVSRWGKDGVIVEADFKQLEMVELAILSGDKQLIYDIHHGVDMHEALFKDMHGRPMKKEERKPFKRCSFALVYGAGATGIAEQGGISTAGARKFIEAFYGRYKGVKEYHDNLIEWAKVNREYCGRKDPTTGKPSGEATWTALGTGRRYVFHEYPAPEFMQRQGVDMSFSPTELKNYMVQGGATGDKVPMMVGVIHRVLRNRPDLRDKCLLINTVHDSIMFDVHKSVLLEALTLIKTELEKLGDYYEQQFKSTMPLPFKVELSYGPNWLDQKEVTYNNNEWRQAA